MTKPPMLRVVWSYIKEYAIAVIAAGLIYGGIHQIISAFLIPIYPIANVLPRFADAILKSEFRSLPPLSSYYYNEAGMWVFMSRMVVVGVFAIVVGILVGLWANTLERRATVPNR